MESNHASLIIACICIALSGVAAHVNEPPEPSSNITVCYPSRSNNTAFATINMICNMTELIKVSQAVPCTVNFMPIAEAEASQEWSILFDGEKAAQPVQKGSSIDSSIVWFANLPVETAARFGTQITFSSNALTSGNVLAYVGCGLSAAVKYQRLDGANLRRVASARKQVSILAGPAIQSLGNTTALIVWRLDAGGGQGSDSNQCTVRVGRSPSPDGGAVFKSDGVPVSDGSIDCVVPVAQLTPGQKYFYSVGFFSEMLATGAALSFTTLPPAGIASPIRMICIGDSGSGNKRPDTVVEGLQTFLAADTTGPNVSMSMFLGDLAYWSGLDGEYTKNFFGPMHDLLLNMPMFAVLGNHEKKARLQEFNDGSAIGVGAYFNRIRTPQLGESGGLPSHTPAYYSIDFGRTHIVCLDSMMSNTTRHGRQAEWLRADLSAAKASGAFDWFIAVWHHTPYTKGLFDSDWYKAIVVMRVVFMPIIESHGVDIVLTAHAHGYERSHLIDGHYHNASYFSERNMVRRGTGSVSDPYQKPQGIHGHQGTVIVVSGNGGYVTEKEYGMMHPAMVPFPDGLHGSLEYGSFVMDVVGNRAVGRFIDTHGAILDEFHIVKTASVPVRSPTTP